MKKFLTLLLLTVTVLTATGQGFYKDIYMDGGIRLTSRKDLPAARRIGASLEKIISTKSGKKADPHVAQDTIMQNMMLVGSEIDHNGVLLYPDGAPRFKVYYVNGGSAGHHGRSLTEAGRENVRQYIKNGGSYVGTCAGMFIATQGTPRSKTFPRKEYFHIWPGMAKSTGLRRKRTGHFIEKGSPLLNYYDFGGDMYIDSVFHNGGGFIYQSNPFPDNTEILLRYDYPELTQGKVRIHNEVSTWAWKEGEKSGRVVVTGSHPESVTSGERLDLMSALLLYAIDGVGTPQIKGELKKGEPRVMDKSTLDYDPDYTKIGDKQYHHFTVEIPVGARNIEVKLVAASRYDLNLFMSQEGPAFSDKASILDISKGGEKTIKEASLQAGTWYISVECATTVGTVQTPWGDQYSGDLSVLNGVPYTITVDWK